MYRFSAFYENSGSFVDFVENEEFGFFPVLSFELGKNTTLTLEGNWQGFGIGAGVFVVGERQGDTDNTFTISAYDRVDALLYYRRNNWQAQLNIENLFNENYIESADGFVTFGAPFIVRGQLSAEF